MLKFSDMNNLGRPVRQDTPPTLGRATQDLICEAIDEGRYDEAKALTRYTVPEGKSLHDLFCDWIWDLLTRVANRLGENAMYQVLRESQGSWMLKRSWKGFLGMPVEQRVQLTAEMMRAHHGGPLQDGSMEITEDAERYSIVMDPCGSGGRMRRGDPVDGTPSRLKPPYEFGVTKEAHDWSWGRKGVPYYCLHCCVNETLPMEWGGHPLWVTDFEEDAAKPCTWHFYKTAEAIPERYYTRVGRTKPPAGEGSY